MSANVNDDENTVSPFQEELQREMARTGGDQMKALQRIERRRSDQLITEAVQRASDGETDWDTLAAVLGRNHRPFLLTVLWRTLPTEQRVKGICDAWTFAEFPERYLRRDEWLSMFRAVGYLDEDRLATPPEQITLWRGGVHKTRMAWTADRDRAAWFQHRPGFAGMTGGKPGKLWTVTVGAERLLAHFHERHRHEDEYVIDPVGLRPKEVKDS